MDLTYSNSSDGSRFQQLPTLWQVLHRKTLPPVCLFNFYLYMRDHERSSEEVDFWLDVTAHELLWRLYVRATKRRLTQERMEREERNAGEAGEAGEAEERKRVREAAAALALAEAEMLESEQRKLQQVEQGNSPFSLLHQQTDFPFHISLANSNSQLASPITLGTSGVTKEDLQESAERIYYKYLTPQAETPVRIPNSVRRRVAQLMDSKIMIDLGLVFAEAREIVFEGMESYYFPRFIEARVYGNMVHSHRVARAVLGLGILFFGFVIMFCLIFLNRPRSLRRWAVIPIFVGILICTTFQFNICPLMAAFGVSEAKWMQFGKIKEPHIMMLHRKRAVKVVVVALLYTICVGAIFGIVPGHRL
ncbi:RGS domain-containing protein [Dissophora ornata]|nr:RGS domain-containing protein [Dissophora ornata]